MVFVSLVSRAVGLQEELGQVLGSEYSLFFLYAGILPRRAHTSYLSKPVPTPPPSPPSSMGILLVAQVGRRADQGFEDIARSGPGLIKRGS